MILIDLMFFLEDLEICANEYPLSSVSFFYMFCNEKIKGFSL